MGGALTGEHGVGIEKRELMCEAFNDDDIQQQLDIKKIIRHKKSFKSRKSLSYIKKMCRGGESSCS